MKRYILFCVSLLIVLTLSAQTIQRKGAPANVEAVDLGLPSGTKWANMNVGAESPEDYGGYYAWGETEEKDVYSWETYIHCDGTEETCHNIGNDIIGREYDVAHVQWGCDWQMPSLDQIKELLENTTSEWVQVNGVNGRQFRGSNGNSIFFPAAGVRMGGELHYAGNVGHYWSSTQDSWFSSLAFQLHFNSDNADWDFIGRYYSRDDGQSVRPVFVEHSQVDTPTFMVLYNDNSEPTTVSESGIGFARSSDGTYSLSTDEEYHSQLDLSKIQYVNRYYEPILLMSTPEIDFGIVEIGVTKTYPLSVTNKGLFPEHIQVSCLGDFFIAPEDQNFLLESGQSLTFDVSYSPTSEMTSNGSLALTSSGMRGGSEKVILRGVGTDFDPKAHVFPEVVSNSTDNAETLLCDTLNGKYSVNYSGEVPDVKEGSVVFVDNDSTTYIILVTKATRDGNVVSFEGKRGDLSYVFHDVSFTLSTATNDVVITRLNGLETNKRVKMEGTRRVRDTRRLFDVKKKFDIPIVKKGDAKLSLEGSFHPTLDCEMYFEFYEPINDIFEGYAFTKAGLFRSGVKLIGELVTTCNLSVNVKKKSEKYEYDEKEPKLIKENFLPKKNWDFLVFDVPVRVSFGCDLFEKAYFYGKGEFEMYEGFVSTITGTYGFSYDPNDYFNGYVPIKDVDIQFEKTDPTVKGKVEAGLKAYLIPRFYARLYDLVGPCVELKPYFDVNLGGAFQEEFIDTSENGSDTDFISTYINASFGVDWGLGFSVLDEIECKKFADKTWDMGKTFIDPIYLLKSPSDLQLVSESTKKVRKGHPIDLTFDAKCKFLWGTYTSPFFPVIKIDIPKRKYHTYLFTFGNGKADYKWIPQSDDEELYAKVYDKDGKAVQTICLPNPEDDSMRANTNEATNVTANSAVLNGTFDSGNTVVIDKMGFLYSSVETVPKIFGEKCTFVEVDFDDVMEKSCLVEGLNPGTTYYYRAYASNRYGTNYGNVLSFTTGGQSSLTLSTTTVSVAPGKDYTVEVTAGSGDYIAKSSDMNVATVKVEGSNLIITAVGEGTATITIKDQVSGQKAKIEVTVSKPSSFTCPDDHHPHLIDLGLPSGTKWSCCNVGAKLPEGHGTYFAWGETEAKSEYTWGTYQRGYQDGSERWHGKDLGSNIGATDYDAAYAEWGRDWAMPSVNQVQEMLGYCTSEWTTVNGVEGLSFTSRINGGTIFLPASGYRFGTEVRDSGSNGYYWSDTQSTNFDSYAYDLTFSKGDMGWGDFSRYIGLTVRPVNAPKQETHTPAALEAVDLGLPSGTLWANMNVGAESPEDYGGYYAWGETEEKDTYTEETYVHYKDGAFVSLGDDIAGTEYDAATENWGPDWQMPTMDQIQELLDNTKSKWTQVNGMNGRKFTSTAEGNGNSIFLPAAGDRSFNDLYGEGDGGYYWSSTQYPDYDSGAYGLDFLSHRADWYYRDYRCWGRSVRPVHRK